MNGKRRVAVFDFDGTLTSCDTLPDFIAFVFGKPRMLLGFLLFVPQIVLMKFGVLGNHTVKERLFGYFFKGMPRADFARYGTKYVERVKGLLRQDVVDKLLEHKRVGDKIYVVSASISEWVRPVCESLGADVVLGTIAEDRGGVLTGRFASPNCYGPEKVRRLQLEEPCRDEYYLFAYGDSKGDDDMFCYADWNLRV